MCLLKFHLLFPLSNYGHEDRNFFGGEMSSFFVTTIFSMTFDPKNRGRYNCTKNSAGGAGKARFNVATPTYEARTRPLHVQHTYYRIIFKQNPFNIISRGVQRWTSTDFRLK